METIFSWSSMVNLKEYDSLYKGKCFFDRVFSYEKLINIFTQLSFADFNPLKDDLLKETNIYKALTTSEIVIQ